MYGSKDPAPSHNVTEPEYCFLCFLFLKFRISIVLLVRLVPGKMWTVFSDISFLTCFNIGFPLVVVFISVGDLLHFGADPDPRIRTSDEWIRIQLRIRLLSS